MAPAGLLLLPSTGMSAADVTTGYGITAAAGAGAPDALCRAAMLAAVAKESSEALESWSEASASSVPAAGAAR